MSQSGPTVLQVNTEDRGGGAERVAWNLLGRYRRRGLGSYLAVGRKATDDPDVLVLSPDPGDGPASRARAWLADKLVGLGRAVDEARGVECFRYPATYRLPTLTPRPPDVIHLHNLHGGYFDLRALPWLSRQAPLVMTLHDAWLLSGHCAHSLGCERWRTGCGHCPDLTIYPAVRRDRTAENWLRKERIFSRSRLQVATPCAWLMERVKQSMLATGIAEARVIPNGVDRSVFRPADPAAAREALGIPGDALVLLFVARGPSDNPFKDFGMLRRVVSRVADGVGGREIVLLALGEASGPERLGGAELRFVPFEAEPSRVAPYYRAADLYLHAAQADTFPMTVLEALACGTPVVATAVGGIPEQIRSLEASEDGGWPATPAESATGTLVSPGDVDGMERAAIRLLERPDLRRRIGANAVRDVERRFDLDTQVDAYLGWYADLLEARRSRNAMPIPG